MWECLPPGRRPDHLPDLSNDVGPVLEKHFALIVEHVINVGRGSNRRHAAEGVVDICAIPFKAERITYGNYVEPMLCLQFRAAA